MAIGFADSKNSTASLIVRWDILITTQAHLSGIWIRSSSLLQTKSSEEKTAFIWFAELYISASQALFIPYLFIYSSILRISR